MSNAVFPDAGAMDTPVLTPGWTVQNSSTGTDQSLTEHAAATPLPFIAQVTGDTAANNQAAINTLLTELISAGLMAAS